LMFSAIAYSLLIVLFVHPSVSSGVGGRIALLTTPRKTYREPLTKSGRSPGNSPPFAAISDKKYPVTGRGVA